MGEKTGVKFDGLLNSCGLVVCPLFYQFILTFKCYDLRKAQL